MPSIKSLTKPLALSVLLLGASACAHREPISTPIYPPSADLAVEPKPVPPVEIVTSEQEAEKHNAAVEAWGERGWATVGRLCRWAKGHGMAVDCPPVDGAAPRD